MEYDFVFRIAPTMDQGSFTARGSYADALWSYNNARDHDCQGPIDALPPYTVLADGRTWERAKTWDAVAKAYGEMPGYKGEALEVSGGVYYEMMGTVPALPLPDETRHTVDNALRYCGGEPEKIVGRYLVGEPQYHDERGRPRCAYFYAYGTPARYYFGGYQAA